MTFTSETQATTPLRRLIRQRGIGNSLRSARPDPNGAPVGTVTDPNQLIGLHASTHIVLKDMAALLQKHYPGFRWVLQPNEFGGVIAIFCADFSTRWGYLLRYDDVMHDPKRRQTLIAARTILRRFEYPGNRFDPLAIASMPRNAEGECLVNPSGLTKSRFTLKAELELALSKGKAKVVGTQGGKRVVAVEK